MDSGSSLIYAPSKAARAFHKHIPGASKKWFSSHYTFPCHVLKNITVKFVFGGMPITMSPETLSIGSDDGGITCYSSITESSDEVWVMGTSFLGNVYSLWDADAKTISFAQLK